MRRPEVFSRTLDVEGANELIQGDEVFDQMNRDIESECLGIVVTQAPVALRLEKNRFHHADGGGSGAHRGSLQ